MATTTEILVCQAGSCRRRGSEAVLLEIEDLVGKVNDVTVEESGCLGLCNLAPNAAVVVSSSRKSRGSRSRTGDGEQDNNVKYFSKLNKLQDSIKVVANATGRTSTEIENSIPPEQSLRLAVSRAIRTREHAMSIYRWNAALQAAMGQLKLLRSLVSSPFNNTTQAMMEVQDIFQDLLEKAGYSSPSLRGGAGQTIESMLAKLTSTTSMTRMIMPTGDIANYSQWTLGKISVVSRHTAIFSFTSKDRKRGTPHPRGGGKPMPKPRTWHTTLLAPTSTINTREEGPLPWIERDYTPISSAKEWEQGKCDMLIKIYPDGQATSWLHDHTSSFVLPSVEGQQQQHQQKGKQPIRVWLSQPIPTLEAPGLASNTNSGSPFVPASVLLILGGTGVVALPQILHHRNPTYKLGISTKRSCQLHVPMDLVLSCRQDDILMLPEIVEWCQEAVVLVKNKAEQQQMQDESNKNDVLVPSWDPSAKIPKGIRNCTLLLTKGTTSEPKQEQNQSSPFPDVVSKDQHCEKKKDTTEDLLEKLQKMPNARVLRQENEQGERLLTLDIVTQAVSNLCSGPSRIVVSGPSGFNAAVNELLLQQQGIDEDAITILEA